ncbi:MAG: M14 family metallocarboxypeptidase [Sandaracinaceae bacterium]
MPYPIGTPGQPWTDAERASWRARQRIQRSYTDDVLAPIERLRETCEVVDYGALDHGPDGVFPLFALRSRGRREGTPRALITGGVHGYETSGVHGALRFAERHLADYDGRLDVLVVPCVSPWAYERVQRWNPLALDPNRSFVADSPCAESAALMRLAAPLQGDFVLHIDLHETTDTDESEFRPAKAARDGEPFEPGSIPDGFYLVGDTEDPQPAFQQAVLAAVAEVTHIAPADANGQIIGSDVVAPGLILYPCNDLGLCAGLTRARYRTTTEVYPDSPRATPEQCDAAQVAAARAALDFALAATRD